MELRVLRAGVDADDGWRLLRLHRRLLGGLNRPFDAAARLARGSRTRNRGGSHAFVGVDHVHVQMGCCRSGSCSPETSLAFGLGLCLSRAGTSRFGRFSRWGRRCWLWRSLFLRWARRLLLKGRLLLLFAENAGLLALFLSCLLQLSHLTRVALGVSNLFFSLLILTLLSFRRRPCPASRSGTRGAFWSGGTLRLGKGGVLGEIRVEGVGSTEPWHQRLGRRASKDAEPGCRGGQEGRLPFSTQSGAARQKSLRALQYRRELVLHLLQGTVAEGPRGRFGWCGRWSTRLGDCSQGRVGDGNGLPRAVQLYSGVGQVRYRGRLVVAPDARAPLGDGRFPLR